MKSEGYTTDDVMGAELIAALGSLTLYYSDGIPDGTTDTDTGGDGDGNDTNIATGDNDDNEEEE